MRDFDESEDSGYENYEPDDDTTIDNSQHHSAAGRQRLAQSAQPHAVSRRSTSNNNPLSKSHPPHASTSDLGNLARFETME